MRIVFFLSLLLCSCQLGETTSTKVASNPFFDLESFFNKELKSLGDVITLQKKITINGQTESKELTTKLKESLQPFIDSNINRPAWSTKYRVDSLFNENNQLIKIDHIALEEKLKIKKVSIHFSNQEVQSIEIEKVLDNMVNQSYQMLKYMTGKGYIIKNEQHLITQPKQSILIEVSYN